MNSCGGVVKTNAALLCLSLPQVEEYGREMYKLFKVFKRKADHVRKEQGGDLGQGPRRGDTGGAEVEFAPFKMTQAVQEQIEQFKDYLPVVHILCNPGLRQRHWDKFTDIIGFDITPDSGTSLRKMLKYKLDPYLEEFESISAGASKEFSLEKAMQKMEDDWDPISFNTTLYRDTG